MALHQRRGAEQIKNRTDIGSELVNSPGRHTGCRYIHGELTLQFDGLQLYKISSTAIWPDKDNYEDVVQKAIEKTLMGIQGHIESPSAALEA